LESFLWIPQKNVQMNIEIHKLGEENIDLALALIAVIEVGEEHNDKRKRMKARKFLYRIG